LPRPNDPEPSHAPVNGQPSLAEPVRTGVVLVQIAQCREISELLRKYGIVGPAARYIEGDPDRAHGAERWFVVSVPAGTESAAVLQLFAHPEDFDYVQLIPAAVPGLYIPVDPSPSSPPLPALPAQPPLPAGAPTISSGTIALSIPAGAFADFEAQRLIPTAPPSAALVWTLSWRASDALNASWYRQIARVELGRGKFGSAELGGAGFRLTNDTAGSVFVELRYVIGSR